MATITHKEALLKVAQACKNYTDGKFLAIDGANVTIDDLALVDYVDREIAAATEETNKNVAELIERFRGTIRPEDTNFFILHPGKNLIEVSDLVSGYINEGNSIVPGGTTYKYTPDYIPVTPGKYLVPSYSYEGDVNLTRQKAFFRFVNCYNSDKSYLPEVSGAFPSGQTNFLIPEGVTYVRFTVFQNQLNYLMVEQNDNGLPSSEYEGFYGGFELKDEFLPRYALKSETIPRIDALEAMLEDGNIGSGPDQWIVGTSDDLATNPIDLGITTNIASNQMFTFSAQVGANLGTLTIGHGSTGYGSAYVKIDNTNITIYEYYTSENVIKTYAHELNISEFIDVVIQTDESEKITVTINTLGQTGQFTGHSFAGSNGAIYANCTGGNLTNCSLRWTCKTFKSDVQIYTDSYGSMNYLRFPYWLIQWGYKSFLLDCFSGRGSLAAYNSLETNLQYSNPKYVVWLMGMNDPDSTTAVNNNWKTATDNAIALCESKGIEIILGTVPNVRGGAVDDSEVAATRRIHTFKNEITRASGKRIIDWSLAVGAEESENWYNGLLYTDGVHPTELGAKVLASRFIQDCPEIATSGGVGGGTGYDDTSVRNSITAIQNTVSALQTKVNGNIEPGDTTFFNVKTTSNLVNENLLQSGYINASGVVYSNPSYVYTDYFKVTPGKYIVATWLNTNNDTRYTASMRFITIYDSSKEAVSSLGSNTAVNSFLVPDGAAYARVTIASNNVNKLMVELTDDGNPSGNYEAYAGKAFIKDEYISSNIATKEYVDEAVASATPSYGPYLIRYNSENNRLEFVYTF